MLASVGIFGFGQLSISFGGLERTEWYVCLLRAARPPPLPSPRPRPPHKERGFSHAARLARTHARSLARTAKIYGRRRRSVGRPHACSMGDRDVLRF